MKIPYVSLDKQWQEDRNELLPLIEKQFSSGQYIGGEEVQKFERNIADYVGTKFAVALNSGTDALVFGLQALGIRPGDEVITPPNSFIASTAAITHLKAKPIFVDVLPDQNIDPAKIEKAITPKTKALMPVHLTGRVARMDEIQTISDKYSIPIIEDAAQSIGSKFLNQKSGTFSKVGCFSAHPLKNLNALGDAGFLTTNSEEDYHRIMKLRNHGLIDRNSVEDFGYVSRLDTIQAVILNYRLNKLDKLIDKRRKNAQSYFEKLKDLPILLPLENDKEYNTYHTFVIQIEKRDALKVFLTEKGIETSIHYPIPIHLQNASRNLGYSLGDFPVTEKQSQQILTLPINQFLREEEIDFICECIHSFFGERNKQ